MARAKSLPRGDQVSFIHTLLADRLVVGGLEQPPVDLGEQVALLDVLSLGERDLDELAVDLGMDRNGVQRLNGAKPAATQLAHPAGSPSPR